jgi:hypothetical protein
LAFLMILYRVLRLGRFDTASFWIDVIELYSITLCRERELEMSKWNEHACGNAVLTVR